MADVRAEIAEWIGSEKELNEYSALLQSGAENPPKDINEFRRQRIAQWPLGRKCGRCDGCGRVAMNSSGELMEPWTAWEELPPGSDFAVRVGLVKPVKCPDCEGSGFESEIDERIRDARPSPDTLTHSELLATALLAEDDAARHGEDVGGAILKTGGFHLLKDDDGAVVELADKLKRLAKEAKSVRECVALGKKG